MQHYLLFSWEREQFVLSRVVMFSRLMKIDRCELVLVDVTPVGKTSAVTQRRPETQVTWTCVLALHQSVTVYFDVYSIMARRSVAKLSTVISALMDSTSDGRFVREENDLI